MSDWKAPLAEYQDYLTNGNFAEGVGNRGREGRSEEPIEEEENNAVEPASNF